MKNSFFQRYLLPGFVFQSVVIAGGYGTGRELVEFFLVYGPLGGLLAMLLVSTVIWSAACAVSFELSRRFSAYDYRTFFQKLLGGRWWIVYEVAYLSFLMLVLAVIAAAAGSILEETFGLGYAVGVVGMMSVIGYLVFRGTKTIERFFAGWSFVLYAVFLVFFVLCFVAFGPDIETGFRTVPIGSGWALGGVRYAAYNLAIIPGLLFCVRHIETRREAISAGLLAGLDPTAQQGDAAAQLLSVGARSLVVALVSMLGALALMIPVVWMYALTKGLRGYDESIVHALIILPVAVTGIIIIVQNRLALAFSLAGIVGAVRFRTTLEDTKDAVYIFLAIGVGLACGAQALDVAAALTLVFNGIIFVLWKYNLGNAYAYELNTEPLGGAGPLAAARSTLGGARESRLRDALTSQELKEMAGRAARIERYAAAEQTRDARERLNALLVIHAEQVVEAMAAVERSLQEMTSQWRMTEIIPGAGTSSSIDYLLRLGEGVSPGRLMESIKEAGVAVLSVEYHSLDGGS